MMTLGSGVKEELQVLKSSESTRLGMLPSMMVVRTLHQVDGLRLIPSPEIHVRLVDRGVSGEGPPVGLDTARRIATVLIFARLITSR
jgi:hypothetical protein